MVGTKAQIWSAQFAMLLAAWFALFTSSATLLADQKRKFDLDSRVKQNPWLWTVPKPHPPPGVINDQWAQCDEDRFILATLEARQLKPSPPANPQTWLRRVHFLITGLPPSRDQLLAFTRDHSKESRIRVVDELLASPHYGEKWARHWMDLMRYAESRGHEGDYILPNAWQYRDYLIRAFNLDLPYSELLIEHLAGDLLEKPRLRPGSRNNESVLATGWAFLGEEVHSPVDIKQDACDRLDNKVDVFSKTFMGLTVSCARCHDHKFDPIRAEDYYGMTGFLLGASYRQARFETMEEHRQAAPRLQTLRTDILDGMKPVLSRFLRSALSDLPNLIAPSAEQTPMPSVISDSNRLGLLRAALDEAMKPLGEIDANTPHGSMLKADYTRPRATFWGTDGEAFGDSPVPAGELVLDPDASLPIRWMPWGAARRDTFWHRLRLTSGNENDPGRLGGASRAGQILRTGTFTLNSGKLHYLLRGQARVYAAVESHILVEGPLHGRLITTLGTASNSIPQWVTHDLSPYAGARGHVEFSPEGRGEMEVLMVVDAATVPIWQPVEWPAGVPPASGELAGIARSVSSNGLALLAGRGRDEHSGLLEPGRFALLFNWLIENRNLFANEASVQLQRWLDQATRRHQDLADGLHWESQTAPAWLEGSGVDDHLLLRGKPSTPGAQTPRRLPVAFTKAESVRDADTSGRLQLAQQLTDPSNPLTARVAVNRIWHHVFGRGIVSTVDNFGELGTRPTHPELLDHLAWTFIHRDRWSMKKTIRRLALSSTFAMSSQPSDTQSEELDPENALLRRMSVRRLEGEAIRDAALAVSGRLDRTIGGRPVMVHLTEFLIGRSRPEKGGPLDGEGRRSVYGAIRRNFLPTLMQAFDVPTPFTTVGRRNTTNVPGQSLALMNDPFFHEQARKWIGRMDQELPNASGEEKVNWLFQTAFGRNADVAEQTACLETLGEVVRLRRGTGTPAAEDWSELAHTLYTANEFIYLQ